MYKLYTGVPGQINWMPVPQAPLGCPPGLEYLTAIDQVVIQQQIELLEGKNCWPLGRRLALLSKSLLIMLSSQSFKIRK